MNTVSLVNFRRERATRKYRLPTIFESSEECNDDDDASTTCSDDEVSHAMTSVMVRNIPVEYTTDMLLEEWPNMGTFDVLYLPYNSTHNRNAGYAFINFTSEGAAVNFRDFWEGKQLARFSKDKMLAVSFAEVQGRQSYLELFQKKALDAKPMKRQPVVFTCSNGTCRKTPLSYALAEVKVASARR